MCQNSQLLVLKEFIFICFTVDQEKYDCTIALHKFHLPSSNHRLLKIEICKQHNFFLYVKNCHSATTVLRAIEYRDREPGVYEFMKNQNLDHQ